MDALYWYASIFLWSFCTGVGLPPLPEEAGILYAASLTAPCHRKFSGGLPGPLPLSALLQRIWFFTALVGYGDRGLLEHRWVVRYLAADRRRRIEDRFHLHGMKFLLIIYGCCHPCHRRVYYRRFNPVFSRPLLGRGPFLWDCRRRSGLFRRYCSDGPYPSNNECACLYPGDHWRPVRSLFLLSLPAS